MSQLVVLPEKLELSETSNPVGATYRAESTVPASRPEFPKSPVLSGKHQYWDRNGIWGRCYWLLIEMVRTGRYGTISGLFWTENGSQLLQHLFFGLILAHDGMNILGLFRASTFGMLSAVFV